jgi:hypothetical protein
VADPITFATVFFSALASGATAGIVGSVAAGSLTAAIGYAVGGAVLAAGINSINKPKQPRFGGNLTVQKSPIGSRALILGRTALGGNVCTDLMRTGRNSGVATAVYGLGGVGPVGAIESIIWGADTLTFGGSAGSIQIVNSPSKYSGKPFWIVQKSGAWNQTAINISAGGSGLESGAHPSAWTTNHRLGGFLAVMMIFGAENPIFKDNFHQPIFVVDANAVVMKDPRTAANATTELQRRNPWVAAYQFAKGFYSETSVKVHGIGLSEDLIDGTSFAAAATIADDNDYTIGGVLPSNPSNVWQDLRSIAQAGGGDVTIRNGKLTAVISAAKTSIGTITEDDLAANPSISAAVEGSQLPNRIIPRFVSESNGWQVVDGSAVTDSAFVTAQDGKQITTTIELPLCGGGAAQAGILAAYALVNTREPLSIVLELKPQARFIGQTGDCVTLQLPSSGLSSHKVLITEMTYRTDLSCQIRCITETDSKHAWALGKTTTAPDYTVTTPYDVNTIPTPAADAWASAAATLSGGGTVLPVINVTGASDWPGATGIVVKVKLNSGGDWLTSEVISPNATAHQIRGLKPETEYVVGVGYIGLNNQEGAPRSLASVTTAALAAGTAASVPWTGVTDPSGNRPDDNADVTSANTAAAITGQGDLATLDTADTAQLAENATFIDNKFTVDGSVNVGWGNEYEFGSITTTVAGGTVQIFLNGDFSASSLSTGGNLELVFQRVRSGTTLDLATYVFAKTGAGNVAFRSKLFISRASNVLSGDVYKVIMRVTGGTPGGASLFDTDLIITHLKR